MTTLYRLVPIESAEQAEALPAGTIATHAEYLSQQKDAPIEGMWGTWGDSQELAREGGWTALVPVEAAEKLADRQIHITHMSPPAPQQVPVRLPCPRCGLR